MQNPIAEPIKRSLIEALSQLPYETQVGLLTGLAMRLMITDSEEKAQANG